MNKTQKFMAYLIVITITIFVIAALLFPLAVYTYAEQYENEKQDAFKL